MGKEIIIKDIDGDIIRKTLERTNIFDMAKILAYPDGSASTKGGKLGGYGLYIDDGENSYCYRQGFSNTKTGRMELKAMITCLQKVTNKLANLEIRQDSEYVVKCITERRLWSWKRVGWIGIKNVDLIVQFYEEYTKFKYPPKVSHIKGHTNLDDIHSLGNAIADKLADLHTQTSYERDLE